MLDVSLPLQLPLLGSMPGSTFASRPHSRVKIFSNVADLQPIHD